MWSRGETMTERPPSEILPELRTVCVEEGMLAERLRRYGVRRGDLALEAYHAGVSRKKLAEVIDCSEGQVTGILSSAGWRARG